jgi:hypothetical protein
MINSTATVLSIVIGLCVWSLNHAATVRANDAALEACEAPERTAKVAWIRAGDHVVDLGSKDPLAAMRLQSAYGAGHLPTMEQAQAEVSIRSQAYEDAIYVAGQCRKDLAAVPCSGSWYDQLGRGTVLQCFGNKP